MPSKSMPLPFVSSFQLQTPNKSSDSLAYTLGSLSFLFCQAIPEVGNKELTIIIDLERETPICFRKQKQIILSCEPQRWSQAAYQFGHELCHYSIPTDVHPKLRWLEETICQVSSLYFLYRMTTFWHETGITYKTDTGELYAGLFAKYAEDVARDVVPFDFTNPSEIANLEADCYQRNKNHYIANNLLPIFNAHPDLWSTIPILCQVRDTSSLQASLDEWLELSPLPAHPGLHEVRALFVL